MPQSDAIKDREFNKFIGLEDSRSAVLTYSVNPVQINIDGGLNYLGEYDNATNYVLGDVVTYEGSSYVSLVNNLDVLPTENTWQIIAEKGEQGEQGEQGPAGDDAPTIHSGLTLDDGTNPHGTTSSDVGLGNVDNTSDLDKPISTLQQDALDLKYDNSNPNGFETPSELDIRDTNNRDRSNHTGTQLANTISDFDNSVTSSTHANLTNNPHAVTKAQVGLSNVDNTSDINKPISTLQQDALNLKKDIFDPQFMSEFFDDFIMGIKTNLGWTLTQAGSGAGASNTTTDGSNASQKAVGVLHLDTGGTATGRTVVSRQTGAFALGYFEIDQRWRFRLGAISSGVDRYVIYVGIHDLTGNGAPVDGVYFVYSDSFGPNWLCITRSNNTQTTIDSGVAVDNGYNRFKIIVNSSGTEAQFFINEVLVATSTTNIPNTSARLSGIALNLKKIIGTAQSSVYIDYYYHKITIPGGRD